jgi:protein arginine kinase activator
MFCENCAKNLATVWVTKIYGDTVSKSHLCQKCAEELTDSLTEEWPYIFSGILSAAFPVKDVFKPFRSSRDTLCPSCKTTYNDFLETGFVGCPDCYQSFRQHMDPLIKQVQGSLVHTGKLPKLIPEEMKLQLELKRLKSHLFSCIHKEDYEKAAQLRDEINDLKGRLKSIG